MTEPTPATSDPSGPIASAPPVSPEKPVENLRIKFWGVQGSCALFPQMSEVLEYARQIAVYTLSRARARVAEMLGGGCSVDQLLGLMNDETVAEAFQQHLGLPVLPVYGGETTCVEITTADGDVFFIDGGSGIRQAAKELIVRWKDRADRSVHLFGTHEHLDHRSGLPFSALCFVKPNPFKIHVYGTHDFLAALDNRFGLYSQKIDKLTHMDDPLDYRMMAAGFTGTELRDGDATSLDRNALHWDVRDLHDPIRIGRTTITAFHVYHGRTQCLAYKFQRGGKTFVFCTDHELRRGVELDDERQKASMAAEKRLREHCAGADAAYFDGQYYRREYYGQKGIGVTPAVPRIDWGHSCIEDALERAAECGIARTYVGHHDPEREWMDRVKTDEFLAKECKGKPYRVELAKADDVLDL